MRNEKTVGSDAHESETRAFWTSGKDMIQAANQMGIDKPVCDNAMTAHQFVADDDTALYRITIERFPIDAESAMKAYLESIDR